MSLLGSISAIKGFLSVAGGVKTFFKDHKTGITVVLIVLLGLLCYGFFHKWRQAERENKEFIVKQAKNARAARDTRQQWEVTVRGNYEKKLALKDTIITNMMDSLDIKDRHVKRLERLAFGKSTTVTVTEYDTLYELIETTPVVPKTFTVKHDNCVTLFGEFTKKGLKTTIERNIKVFDLSYTKRDRLFGWKWTPRIGKKQHYQTLITNCGDTIKQNQQINFERR